MRVAIVTGAFFSEQLELWRACRAEAVDIFMIGSAREYEQPWREWPWQGGLPSDFDGVELTPVGPLRRRGQLWWWYPGLARALRSFRPHVVHVLSEPWGCRVIDSLVFARNARRGAPVCAHGAENIYRQGSAMEQRARNVVLNATLPHLGGFVSWNEAGIELARGFGLPTEVPTAVIPAVVPNPGHFTPVTGEKRAELRRRLGLPLDRIVLGFFGRLVPQKGTADLIAALAALDDHAPYLAVWGHGPDAPLLETYVSRSRGVVRPPLPLGEVADAFAACDIVAVPSRTTPSWAEQFGRVAVEAMLSGCAVVAYDSGALPEVIGEGGLIVPESDISELGKAIDDLTAKASLRDAVSCRGRARALSLFSPAALAPRMLAFWREVVER